MNNMSAQLHQVKTEAKPRKMQQVRWSKAPGHGHVDTDRVTCACVGRSGPCKSHWAGL
jgi:hypothetical protein